MNKKNNEKYYAIVFHGPCKYSKTSIAFVWDKKNSWTSPAIAVPKPLSYRTAMNKVKKEMANDRYITKTMVIAESEYSIEEIN